MRKNPEIHRGGKVHPSSGKSEFEPEFDGAPVITELYAVGKLLHNEHTAPPTFTKVLRTGGVGDIVGVKTTSLVTDPYRNTIGHTPRPDFDFFGFVALVAMTDGVGDGFRNTDQDIWIEIPANRIFPYKVVNERLYFADAVEIGWQFEHKTYLNA